MRKRLVMIGNGMAAGRLVDELLKRAPDLWDITIFGAESRVNYNRIMLSPVLAGEKTFEEIVIHDEEFYARNKIALRRGETIEHIDRENRFVRTATGARVTYDTLVIATGSQPFVIPVPGVDLPGVVTFRDLDDVEKMREAARKGGRAVVIGGGLLGLEAAAGLAARGMKTTVVHLMPTLMERQLDPDAGSLLRDELESRGIDIVTGANTRAVRGEFRATGVELEDGRVLPSDLVVMAVGIRPNAALAKSAGLDVKRGVSVDDFLRTSDPDIFALGECAEHRGVCYGLVAPLYEMAETLAARLSGESGERFEPSVTATKLKVTGIDLFSAGDFADGPDRQDIVLRNPLKKAYRRVVLRQNSIVGAVLYGDTQDGGWYFDLIKRNADVGAMRDMLIFGKAYHAGAGSLAEMAIVRRAASAPVAFPDRS